MYIWILKMGRRRQVLVPRAQDSGQTSPARPSSRAHQPARDLMEDLDESALLLIGRRDVAARVSSRTFKSATGLPAFPLRLAASPSTSRRS